MKHIFIVNPASGKKNSLKSIQAKIDAMRDEFDCEIYVTKGPNDANNYIKSYCRDHQTPVRFYACGGDGTLNEAINGVVGFDFAAVGCVPCGSGNDFVKYYGDKSNFLDITKQLNGTEESIDLIRVGDRYAVNAVHFGLDSCVANMIVQNRRKFLIGGRNAYPFAVLVSIIIGMRHKCHIEVDGEPLNQKKEILLCTLCNGQYVGGSYHCAPRSLNNDGLLECCCMDAISHLKFFRTCNAYKEGTHLDDPRFQKFMHYKRGKVVHVTAPEDFIFSMDGEIIHNNDFTAEIVPGAIKFVVPKDAKCIIDPA